MSLNRIKRVYGRAVFENCSEKTDKRKNCKEGSKLINGKINAESGLLCFRSKLGKPPEKSRTLTFSSGSTKAIYVLEKSISIDPSITFELS